MESTKEHICPKCGAVMVKTPLDGTHKLDGSIDLSGYYCPECTKNSANKKEN